MGSRKTWVGAGAAVSLAFAGALLVGRASSADPAANPSLVAAAEAPSEDGQGESDGARPSDDAEEAEHDFPFLADEDETSISVGDTSDGYLVRAVALEESERLAILPRQRARNLRYGTAPLIELIQHAAATLHEATGTRLWVGNIGRRGGGDIPYSVSHNSGRDADIAFCYLDRDGKPADPPDLVPLDGRGISVEHGLRFDAARTWLVVKALLTAPHANVQWLFISRPLKQLLLAHAARSGEPPDLVRKASEAMLQPPGSGAHHDHLHVRIYCSERDALGGCLDTGTMHPWYRSHRAAKEQRIEQVAAFLRDDRPDQRRRALDRLVLLDARDRLESMVAALADDAPEVRASAARAIGSLGEPDHAAPLADLYPREDDAAVRIAIVQAAGSLGGKHAGELLRVAVGPVEPELAQLATAVETWAETRGLSGRALAAMWPAIPAGIEAAGAPGVADFSWTTAFGGWWTDRLFAKQRLDDAIQLAALDAAARSERLEPVEAILPLLDDHNPDIRFAANRALRMITNLSYPGDFRGAAEARAKGVAMWRAAWARSHRSPRSAFLVTGFRARGYDIPRLSTRHAWELVRAVAGDDHLSFNAQRTLMRLFEHEPPSLSWSKQTACLRWLRWVDAVRKKHKLKKPPPDLKSICSSTRD